MQDFVYSFLIRFTRIQRKIITPKRRGPSSFQQLSTLSEVSPRSLNDPRSSSIISLPGFSMLLFTMVTIVDYIFVTDGNFKRLLKYTTIEDWGKRDGPVRQGRSDTLPVPEGDVTKISHLSFTKYTQYGTKFYLTI